MARLRLFANLREAAGTAEARLDGATVGEVVDQAAARYGDEFAAGLPHARVWVNGDPAERDTAVAADDEVALIPPVSGGALALDAEVATGYLLTAGLGLALFLANLTSLRWFVVVLVAVAGLWLWDLAGYAAARGVVLNAYPAFFAAAAAAAGAFRWGFAGFAFATVLGVAVLLAWGLLVPGYRPVEAIVGGVTLAVAGSLAAGPLVLLRLRDQDAVTAFLLVAALATVAGRLAAMLEAQSPLFDSNLAALVGALVGGVIAGALWGDLTITVVAAVVAAAGLVAGRTLGSLLRSGRIYLAQDPPGFLSLLDGPFFASGLFWVTLALLS